MSHSSEWWVYILLCSDNTLYTGVAKDVVRRLDEHNNSPKAAKYTRVRRPVQLGYLEPVVSRSSALKRELSIKSLSRTQKEQLIEQSALESKVYADNLDVSLVRLS